MASARRIYLDANAIIRFLESDGRQIEVLFDMAASRAIALFTSELSLAEVLVVPLRDGDANLIAAYDEFLVSDDVMTVVPISRSVLRRSAEVRALLGGKGPDAIQVATAIDMECGGVVSSDKRLRLPPDIRRVAIEDVEDIDRWL